MSTTSHGQMMTIDEYVAELKRDADRFAESWKKNNATTPERYPNEMAPGEWFEQYLSFFSIM